MYYLKTNVSQYYRKYKGVKKPLRKINLKLDDKFEAGDSVVILHEEDFNNLIKNSSIQDGNINGDPVDVNKLIETNKKLQHQLDIMDNMPQMLELIHNHKEELNKLHDTHKKELLDKDEELKKHTNLNIIYSMVISDLLNRGLLDRVQNKKPKSYLKLSSELMDNDELLYLDDAGDDTSKI